MWRIVWSLTILSAVVSAGEVVPGPGGEARFLELLRSASPLPGDLHAEAGAPGRLPDAGFEPAAEYPLDLLLGRDEPLYLGGKSGPTLALDGPRGTILVPIPTSPAPGVAEDWKRVLEALRGGKAGGPETRQALARLSGDPKLSGDPRFHYLAGMVSYQSGDVAESEESFRRAAALNENDAYPLLFVAMFRIRSKDPKGAIEPLREALSRAPNSATASGLLGEAYARLGAHFDAIRCLAPAVDAPASPPYWRLLLARSLLVGGQPEKAWDQIEALPPRVRETAPAKLMTVHTLLRRRLPGEALTVATELVTARPRAFHAWWWKAEAELRLKRLADADRSATTAVGLRPEAAVAKALLGRVRLRQGKTEDGVRLLREAVGQVPGLIWIHRFLGDALVLLGRGSEAVAAYERFLEKRPRGPVADKVRKALEALR